MPSPDPTPATLDAVMAELAVRNVLARLAQLADLGDTDGYLALLTDDVVWDMPANPNTGLAGSRREGHEAIATGQRDRMAAGAQGPGSGTRHTVSTVWVQVDGDRAHAESCFQFLGSTLEAPTILSVGTYVDELRRDADATWRLAHRTITFG